MNEGDNGFLELCSSIEYGITEICKQFYGFDVESLNVVVAVGNMPIVFTITVSIFDGNKWYEIKSDYVLTYKAHATTRRIYEQFLLLLEETIYGQDCSRIVKAIRYMS